MNPLETTKQALAILMRGHSGDWDSLTDVDRQKLLVRAQTLIALGHSILRKIGAEVVEPERPVEVYGRFYENDSKRECIHNALGGEYCRACKAMAVLNGQYGCGCYKCLGKDLAEQELSAAKLSLDNFYQAGGISSIRKKKS